MNKSKPNQIQRSRSSIGDSQDTIQIIIRIKKKRTLKGRIWLPKVLKFRSLLLAGGGGACRGLEEKKEKKKDHDCWMQKSSQEFLNVPLQ